MKKVLSSVFNSLFKIEPEKFWLVQLFLIYLIIIAAEYIITSTSSITLFLSRSGQINLHFLLPWIYIGNAICLGIVAFIYRKLLDSFSRIKLITISTMFFAISFLLIRFLLTLPIEHIGIYFFTMLWNEACFSILIMAFYSFLGDYFHLTDAKQVYAYITGGIALGLPIGGFGSAFLLHYISTPDLFYITAVLLLLSNIIAYLISKYFFIAQMSSTKKPGAIESFSFKELFSNKYVRLLLLLSFFGVLCTCIDAFQFFYVASRSLNEKEMGNFLGIFFGYMGVGALIVNYILAKWIINQLDIVWSLLILPSLLVLCCFGFIISPVLTFAAAIKFVDGILYQTINTIALQMLYLTLPQRVRVHSQSIAMGVLTAGARFLSGAILVVLSFFIIPIQTYSFMILIISIAWIMSIILLFPLYKKIILRT